MPDPTSSSPTSALGSADGEAFAARLRDARSVSAFCHENPDGDTLGAAVAISLIATRLGKRSEVVCVDDFPLAYGFLAGADEIRREPQLDPDLAIVCDAATLARVGSVLDKCSDWFDRATIVNIDHHVTNTRFGALNIVDEHAAATCQVVAELLPLLDVRLDQEIATALLTGLVRDSYGFSTASTTPRTLRAAAAAVEAGAPIEAIYRATLHELPIRTMELWARLLASMKVAFGNQVVYTVLTTSLLADTGTEQHDADGVADFLARVEGARVTILFRELGSSTRVSVRTAPGVDAAAIAGAFDGGGHLRRSGFTLPVASDRAIQLVLGACLPHIDGDTPVRARPRTVP